MTSNATRRTPPEQRSVFVAMPHYGMADVEAVKAFFTRCTDPKRDDVDVHLCHAGRSLLANTFNLLWCGALNSRASHGLTHFAMMHSDIIPQLGWVDVLLEELEGHDADVVSAVVPFKDNSGLTSTAIDSAGDPWEVERRLTMREVMRLPETFTAADCGYPDRALAINSGCWIARFTEDWVERVAFTIRDTITQDADGTFRPRVMSEDWDFGRQLHRLGLKVMATRKVALKHRGPADFENTRARGNLETDHLADGPLPCFAGEGDFASGFAGELSPLAPVPVRALHG